MDIPIASDLSFAVLQKQRREAQELVPPQGKARQNVELSREQADVLAEALGGYRRLRDEFGDDVRGLRHGH